MSPALPPKTARGNPLAMAFCEYDQVRHHTADLAVSPQRMAETGLHLVEDEDEAELVREYSEALEIPRLRFDDTDVLQNGLGDQGRDLVALTHVTHGLEVVEIDYVDESLLRCRQSGAEGDIRVFTRRHCGADLFQWREHVAGELIVRPVEAPLHGDHVLATRNRARQPQGGDGGLGTGVEELDSFGRGDVVADELRQAALELGRPGTVEAPALVQSILHRLIHEGIVVAE